MTEQENRAATLYHNPGGHIEVGTSKGQITLTIPSIIDMTPEMARLLANELLARAFEVERDRELIKHFEDERKVSP